MIRRIIDGWHDSQVRHVSHRLHSTRVARVSSVDTRVLAPGWLAAVRIRVAELLIIRNDYSRHNDFISLRVTVGIYLSLPTANAVLQLGKNHKNAKDLFIVLELERGWWQPNEMNCQQTVDLRTLASTNHCELILNLKSFNRWGHLRILKPVSFWQTTLLWEVIFTKFFGPNFFFF